MNEISGSEILKQVKERVEPFKEIFSGKKVTIIRFSPPAEETDPTTLAKYEAARFSSAHKVKTFEFIGCAVDSQLKNNDTAVEEFDAIIARAAEDPHTVGIIVQNPIPDKHKPGLKLIPQELDIDGMQENHPLFRASATSESIARLVKSFADNDTIVAVVGGKGFVGQGVIRLLEQDNINCLSLDKEDNLLRTLDANIIVSATGVPEILDERHIRPYHKLVVDAGFVPIENQIKPVGDVNRSAYSIPQNLTPVPGGVGPLQMATLLERLIHIHAADRSIEKWAVSNINPEQLRIAEEIVPIALRAFESRFSPQTNRTPSDFEELKGTNYTLTLNAKTNTFTIAANDGRGDLIRVEQSSGNIKYAANITSDDVTAWQQTAREISARSAQNQQSQRPPVQQPPNQQPPSQQPPNQQPPNQQPPKQNRDSEWER